MTSLFTQVWLWSLAAFLLGSVATWLLFVLPLRRRLRRARRELAEFEHSAAASEWEPEEPDGEHDTTAWEILPLEAEPDSEPEPSPDRPFRTGDLAGYWSLRPGAPGAPAAAEANEGPAEADAPGTAEYADPVENPVGGRTDDDADIRLEAQRQGMDADDLANQVDAEATQRHDDRMRAVRGTPPPTAPAELGRQEAEESPVEPGGNTWFRKVEWTDHDDGSEPRTTRDAAAADESLSGQLRSLFESLDSGESRNRADVAVTPPAGPRPGPSDAPNPTDEDGSNPLPRRVPGATSRPGTPPANRPPGHEPPAQPPPEKRWPSAEEAAGAATPPEEWYPDEVQPVRERPDEGYTVKGHFASRQYHTPESPHFDRVAAEVWFRTAADAEQAGFEPWDGRRRG